MVSAGKIVGFIAAEITYQSITVFTAYKSYKMIPKIVNFVKKISTKYKRSEVGKSKIFDDICDNYDSFLY
jgi:hypothetical protein